MKVALIGGAGFLGKNLCEALLKENYTVHMFDQANSHNFTPQDVENKLHWFEGDFLNADDLSSAIQGCEIVFHLVSTTLPKNSNEDMLSDVSGNVMGSIRLMQEAKKCGVRRVIFISSGGTVYGRPEYIPMDERHPTNPVCSYGITKLMVEKYFALYKDLYDLDYIVLRLSNPFGEYQRATASQGAVAVFLGKAMRGESIEIWGDGSVERDYLYVGDVINAMLAAIRYEGLERVFNIASGQGRSLLNVIECIMDVTGLPVDYCCTKERDFDVPINVLSIERAKTELGWMPRTEFCDGLMRMFEWYKIYDLSLRNKV